MRDEKILAERFEADRPRLKAAAYRMLGSRIEAEDAVQEAWLRLARIGPDSVGNLSGWLTTVVARICLDALRARRTRREEPIGDGGPEPVADDDPEHRSVVADSVGAALQVVLETLGPAERVAFVLHDMFDVPFEEIAPIVQRTPAAARQLASRARRRVEGSAARPAADPGRRRLAVEAFLTASRDGDFAALFTMLDPDVVFRADRLAAQMGGAAEIRGARAVAETFRGRAQGARPALADGEPAIAVPFGGRVRIVLMLVFRGDRIASIEAIADPERIGSFDLVMLDQPG